jgi:LysR family nitrogen assimilation transcriptional regulator
MFLGARFKPEFLGFDAPSGKYNLTNSAFVVLERRPMDSRQLRYFIAVYEQRNLSRAADQTSVAQSALSHHISNLEAEFATPLFERKPRGMEPTAAGERLYEHARIILRAMASAEREIKQGSATIAGDISIGMANSGVKAIGVPLMRAVLAKYPDLKLALTESLSGSTLLHLMASDVDLALVYNPPLDKDLVAEPVLEEEMYCVGIAKLVGKSKAPMTFDELTRTRLILLRNGLSSRALLDDPVLLKRIEANAILHLNSITGITGALLAGLGCAVATKLFVKEQLADKRLVAREIVAPKLTRTLYLCRLSNRPMTYVMEEMRRLMLSLIAEEVGRGAWEAKLLI